MAKHVGVVLAAGGSSRLGVSKQLLHRDGETLVHRAVRLVVATGAARVVVVLGAGHDRITRELADLPHIPVVNMGWQQGLAGSLRAAAPHVTSAVAVLVVACDQPALDENHLRVLLAGAQAAPLRCAATDTGSVLGIPAVVPGGWFAQLQAEGDRGFRERLRSAPADAIFRLWAPELALDIDTPNDLKEAASLGLADSHVERVRLSVS